MVPSVPIQQTIRVVLADDHQIIRDGLRALISLQPDMEVLAEASDGRSTAQAVAEHSPDVVVMDISMPDLNGIEATRQIRLRNPRVQVLALSMHSDRRLIAGMLSAGARGYVLKDCAFDEIAQAIRTVAAGKTFLSPSIADIVVEEYVQHGTSDEGAAFDVLTPRETEVLQLVAEGHGTKAVAARLHISIKTVETHRRQIMEKLGIYTVPELTKYAIREGLTTVDR
jgi:two-component system, NarL family, response regulator NreC